MAHNPQFKLIGIVLLTMVAAFVVAPIPSKPQIPILSDAKLHLGIDLAGGAELRYKVLFDPSFPGDKRTATRKAIDVLRRRLEAKHLREVRINARGDTEIMIELPGVDAEELREYKRLIEPLGNLALYAAAPDEDQARYARERRMPAGYRIVENAEGAPFLVQENPVIEGRHIKDALAVQEAGPMGALWVTSFELDEDGAKRFDEAAERLYRERPPGRLAIVFDGRMRSAPVVQSPSFHGRGQISGAKDRKEAEDLAIILRSGSLPAPLGSTSERPR